MKTLVLFASLAVAAPAVADPVALDFQAGDGSCIDAARFEDQVSAKLGFVPWDATAKLQVHVRVAREGEGFTGSFRNADGSEKTVEGATCAAVTSTLAVTVAAALDRSPPKALAAIGGMVGELDDTTDDERDGAATPPPAVHDTIPVRFVSADGSRVDIALNTGGGVGRAGGHTVVASYYTPLCTSPCTARLPRGRDYLTFEDPDTRTAGHDYFLFDRPTTLTLHHESRSGLRRGLFISGVLLLGGGIAALVAGPGGGAGRGILGGVGIGLGTPLMIASPFVHDTYTVTRSP